MALLCVLLYDSILWRLFIGVCMFSGNPPKTRRVFEKEMVNVSLETAKVLFEMHSPNIIKIQ